MALSSSRFSVLWLVASVLLGHHCLPSAVHATPEPGSSGSRCQGYGGAEGTCELADCPTIQHDLETLSVPDFVARHGHNCTNDQDRRKLFCCPKEIQITKSCGKSTLAQNRQSGLALPSSWPWFALLYSAYANGTVDEYGWTGCDGVLVSEKHVLTYVDCAYFIKGIRVLLGKFSEDPADLQIMSIATAVRPLSWQDVDGLIILTLAENVVLKPNVVWPICLSLDPITDLGFKLDNLGPFDKNVAHLPEWTRGPEQVLSQVQVLYLNCSRFGEDSVLTTFSKSLCATGLGPEECSRTSSAHGTPMVVTSQVTKDVYLAGMTRSFTCYNRTLLISMMAVTHYVQDIYEIIHQ